MKNAVYGKTLTMKNLRNVVDVRLVNYQKDFLKWTSKESFVTHKSFDDLVVVLKTCQTSICQNVYLTSKQSTNV